MLSTTHELGDGSRVRLRLTRPTDLPRIEAFLERLSARTRARRFAFYDPRERLAIAATQPRAGGEEIVGLADVVLPDTGAAEVSVVVDDEAQDVGLGELLSEAGVRLPPARRRRAA